MNQVATTRKHLLSDSTFSFEHNNLRALLSPIEFHLEKLNDAPQPLCHFSHKNLGVKGVPLVPQHFKIVLNELTNVKYVCIQMSISISRHPNSIATEIYKDSYICKGKTLKEECKWVDLGALPCRAIHISVRKGGRISAKNIGVEGVASEEIRTSLGSEYFELLVANPVKIIYPN